MDLVSAEDISQRIEGLEASHSVASRVMLLVERDDIGAQELSVVISADPVLVYRIMQMANSAFYGTGNRVKELRVAIAIIGFQAVKSLSLTAMIEGTGSVTPQDWQHSISAAIAASEVARRLGADSQLAFSVGLLHDIGRAVMSSLNPALALSVGKLESSPLTIGAEREMLSMERKEFGINHAVLGADVLEYWNFSSEIVQAVANHHPQKGSISRLHGAIVDGDRIARLIESDISMAEIGGGEVLLPQYVHPQDLPDFIKTIQAKATSMLHDLFG